MSKQLLYLIAHNLRSAQNVGSLLRTAEGLGVDKIYLTGYSPYPANGDNLRLPHIEAKVNNRIVKASLGAEKMVDWEHIEDIFELINHLIDQNFKVISLEQTKDSVPVEQTEVVGNIAIIVGREVEGIESEVLERVPNHIFIPMAGKKESFNVASAAAMALYVIKLKRDGQIGVINDKM